MSVIHKTEMDWISRVAFFSICLVVPSVVARDTIIVTDLLAKKIWKAPIESLEFEEIPVQNVGTPVAVDYDPVDHKLYWTDVQLRLIARANLDGTQEEVVVPFLSVPDGLSIDVINRHLYWTDTGTDTIERANLDGTNKMVITRENHDEPRAIVVDSQGGRMFWTDWGVNNSKIERANLDGSDRVVLVDTGLELPNGLAVDFEGNRMYWCDAGLNRIDSADLDGQNRVNLGTFPPEIVEIDIHPFDIGVYNDELYWTDWSVRQLIKMNRFFGREAIGVGPLVFQRAGGLHIFKAPLAIACNPSTVTATAAAGQTTATVIFAATPSGGTLPYNNILYTQSPGTTFPVGTTQVTAIIQDAAQASATCMFTIVVREAETPLVATCTPPTVTETAAAGQTSATVNFAAIPSGGSGTYNPVTYTPQNPGTAFNVGTTVVTAIIQDNAGATARCQFRVVVHAATVTVPLTATCNPSTVTETAAAGQNIATVNFAATPSGGSGTYNPIIYIPQNPGTAFNVGTTVVTAIVQDNAGAAATCKFNVVVNAVPVPLIATCNPSTVTATAATGQNNAIVNFAATPSGGSGTYNPVIYIPQNPGTAFNVGTTTVTAIVQDNAGASATCQFNIDVIEVPLEIDCREPAPVISSYQCNANAGIHAVSFNQAVCIGGTGAVSDPSYAANPAGAAFGRKSNSQVSGRFPTSNSVYTVTVSCVDSLTTKTCQFLVILFQEIDNTNPTVNCPSHIPATVQCGGTTVVQFLAATANDNCGVPTAQYTLNGTPLTVTNLGGTNRQATFEVGTNVVTYTATDAAGNTAQCIFNVLVTVVDNANPSITCAGPITQSVACGVLNLNVNFAITSVTDDCPTTPTVTYSSTGDTTFTGISASSFNMNVGTSVITATAIDASGRQATCSTPVTISENRAPCTNHQCQNSGQCSPFPGSCTLYECICPPCYYGRFCENKIDQCQKHKCENGGVCQPVANSCTDYTCQCSGCFTGNLCHKTITNPCDINPCKNLGRCTRIPGICSAYQCNCASGFSGVTCEIATAVYVNPCNNFPCENGGTCDCPASNQYVCSCAEGYGGINCQTQISSTPSVQSCGTNQCQNNGQCYNAYDSMTNMAVYQNQYTCVCAANFGGINCGVNTLITPALNQCTLNPCQNGGVCRNAYYSASAISTSFCDCPIGFFGKCCEIPFTNPCNSNPCQNNGQCTPFNSHFVCICPPPLSGTTCEVGGPAVGPLIVTCHPSTVTATVATGQNSAIVNFAAVPSGGAPPYDAVIYVPQNPGTAFNVGTTTVTAIVTDSALGIGVCTFNVDVSSTTDALAVTCNPRSVSATAAPGQTSATVNFAATPSGGSGTYDPIIYVPQNPGTAFNIGTTSVTAIVIDNAGGTATCTFSVEVVAAPGFQVTCAPTQMIQSPHRAPVNVFFDVDLSTATGATGAVTYTANPTSGAQFSCPANLLSTQTCTSAVIVTATDASGATATCTFNVIIQDSPLDELGRKTQDTLPPLTTCPPNVKSTPGVPIVLPECTGINNGGFGYVFFDGFINQPANGVYPLGVTSITCKVRDSAGNQGSCLLNVIVNNAGTVPPTINNCPTQPPSPTLPVGTALAAENASSAIVSYTEPSSTGLTPLTQNNLRSGLSHPLGLTQIIYTFGNLGNQAVCSVYVYVQESTDSACSSSPCMMPQTCFSNDLMYSCLSDRLRRRRDTALDCDPLCEMSGGTCLMPEGTFAPACFWQSYQEHPSYKRICQLRPCLNNGTCIDTFDEFMNPSFICECPLGLTGDRCEYYDNPADIDHPNPEREEHFAFWLGSCLVGFVVMSFAVFWLLCKRMYSVPREDEKIMVP